MKEKIRNHIRDLLKAGNRLETDKGGEKAIHRVRVLSRRLETLFRFLFQEKWDEKVYRTHRKFFKITRRLRKALGRVREIDVNLLQWQKLSSGKAYSLPMEKAMKKDRDALWESFLDHFDYRRLKKSARKVEKKLDKQKEALEAINEEALRAQVALLVDKIQSDFRAYQKGSASKKLDCIHRIRIDVKRLRYSAEELGAIIGDGFSAAIPSLKAMQSDLGRLHDWETLQTYLTELLKKEEAHWDRTTRSGVQRVADRAASKFQDEWQKWMSAWPERQKLLKGLTEDQLS